MMAQVKDLRACLEALEGKRILFNQRSYIVDRVDFYQGRYMVYTDLRTFVYYSEQFEKFIDDIKVFCHETIPVLEEESDVEMLAVVEKEQSDPEMLKMTDVVEAEMLGYKRLKLLMHIHSVTVRMLGKHCGIKHADFSMIINGRKAANHVLIFKACAQFFEVPVRVLTDYSVVLVLEGSNIKLV